MFDLLCIRPFFTVPPTRSACGASSRLIRPCWSGWTTSCGIIVCTMRPSRGWPIATTTLRQRIVCRPGMHWPMKRAPLESACIIGHEMRLFPPCLPLLLVMVEVAVGEHDCSGWCHVCIDLTSALIPLFVQLDSPFGKKFVSFRAQTNRRRAPRLPVGLTDYGLPKKERMQRMVPMGCCWPINNIASTVFHIVVFWRKKSTRPRLYKAKMFL